MRNEGNSFAKIAIAVAFSPRCEAILAEARLLHQRFGAQMFFIHIGKKSLQEEQYCDEYLKLEDAQCAWIPFKSFHCIRKVQQSC
jgi:hypothetical protein